MPQMYYIVYTGIPTRTEARFIAVWKSKGSPTTHQVRGNSRGYRGTKSASLKEKQLTYCLLHMGQYRYIQTAVGP